MRDRDQLVSPYYVSGEVATGCSGLSRKASTLLLASNVVADLEAVDPVDALPGQTAAADELPLQRLDDPQPVPIAPVVVLVPPDPAGRLLATHRCRVEAHDLRVSEQSSHRVELNRRHLPKAEPKRRGRHGHNRQSSSETPCEDGYERWPTVQLRSLSRHSLTGRDALGD